MYIIKKTKNNIKCIYDTVWDSANVANINKINWIEYGCVPETSAKLLYNDYGIYVQLQTDEKPLLARYTDQNDEVCNDSCMEFFFRPNENDPRYFNFEFNPFGTMYFAVRTSRWDPMHPAKDKEYFNVKSYVDDKRWILQFCIPFEFIDEIFEALPDVKLMIMEPFVQLGSETQDNPEMPDRWHRFDYEVRKRAESSRLVA